MSQLSDDLADWLYLTDDIPDTMDGKVPTSTTMESASESPMALYMVQFQLCTLGFSFALSITWIGCSEMCVISKTLPKSPKPVSTIIWKRFLSRCIAESVSGGQLLPECLRESQIHFNPQISGKNKIIDGMLKKRDSLLERSQAQLTGQRLQDESLKIQIENTTIQSETFVLKTYTQAIQMPSFESTATLNDVLEICSSEIAITLSKPGSTPLGSLDKQDARHDLTKGVAKNSVKRVHKSCSLHQEHTIESTHTRDVHCEHNSLTRNVDPINRLPAETTWRCAKEKESTSCLIYNQPTYQRIENLSSAAKDDFERTRSINNILMKKAKKVTSLDPGFMSYSPYTPPVRYINVGNTQTIPVTRNLLANPRVPGDIVVDQSTDKHPLTLQESNGDRGDMALCNHLISTNVDEATTDLICGDMQLIINKYSIVQNSQSKSTSGAQKKGNKKYKQTEKIDSSQKDTGQVLQKELRDILQNDHTCFNNDSHDETTVNQLHKEKKYTNKTDHDFHQKDEHILHEQHADISQKYPVDFPKKNHVRFSDEKLICKNELVENHTCSESTYTYFCSDNKYSMSDDNNSTHRPNVPGTKGNTTTTHNLRGANSLDSVGAEGAINRVENTDSLVNSVEDTSFPKEKSIDDTDTQNKEDNMLTLGNRTRHRNLINEYNCKDKTSLPCTNITKAYQNIDTLCHRSDTVKADRCSIASKLRRNFEAHGLHEIPHKLQESPLEIKTSTHGLNKVQHIVQECPQTMLRCDGSLNVFPNKSKHVHCNHRKASSRSTTHISRGHSPSLFHSVGNSGTFSSFYESTNHIQRSIKGPIRGKSFVDKFRPYNIPPSRRSNKANSQKNTLNVLASGKLSETRVPETIYISRNKAISAIESLSPRERTFCSQPTIRLEDGAMAPLSPNSRISCKTCDAVAFLNIVLQMPQFVPKGPIIGKNQRPSESCDHSAKPNIKMIKSQSSTENDQGGRAEIKEFVNLTCTDKCEQYGFSETEISSSRAENGQNKSNLGSVVAQTVREQINQCISQRDSLTDNSMKEKPSDRLTTQNVRPSEPKPDLKKRRIEDILKTTSGNQISEPVSSNRARANAFKRKTIMDTCCKSSALKHMSVSSQRRKVGAASSNPVETEILYRRSGLHNQDVEFKSHASDLLEKQPQNMVQSAEILKRSKIPVLKVKWRDEPLIEQCRGEKLRTKPDNQSPIVDGDRGPVNKSAASICKSSPPMGAGSRTLVNRSPTYNLKCQVNLSTLFESGESKPFAFDTHVSSSRRKQPKENSSRGVVSQMQSTPLSNMSTKWNSRVGLRFPCLLSKLDNTRAQRTARKIARDCTTDTSLQTTNPYMLGNCKNVIKKESDEHFKLQRQYLARSANGMSESKNKRTDTLVDRVRPSVFVQGTRFSRTMCKKYSVRHEQPHPSQGSSRSSSTLQRRSFSKKNIEMAPCLTSNEESKNSTGVNSQLSIENHQRMLAENADEQPTKDVAKSTDQMLHSGLPMLASLSDRVLLPSLEKWKQASAGTRRLIGNDDDVAALLEATRNEEGKQKDFQIGKNQVYSTDKLYQVIENEQLNSTKDASPKDVPKFNKMMTLKRTGNINVVSKDLSSDNFPREMKGVKKPQITPKTPDGRMKTPDGRMKTPERGRQFLQGNKMASFTKRNMAQDVKSKLSCAGVKWMCHVCQGLAQPDVHAQRLCRDTEHNRKSLLSVPAKLHESVARRDRSATSVSLRLLSGISDNVEEATIDRSPSCQASHYGSHPEKMTLPILSDVSSCGHAEAKSVTASWTDERTTHNESISNFQPDKSLLTDNVKINLHNAKQHPDIFPDCVASKQTLEVDQPQLPAIHICLNEQIEKTLGSAGEIVRREEMYENQSVAESKDNEGRGFIKGGQISANQKAEEHQEEYMKPTAYIIQSTEDIQKSEKTHSAAICPSQIMGKQETRNSLLDGNNTMLKTLCFRDAKDKHAIPSFAVSSSTFSAQKQGRGFSKTDSSNKYIERQLTATRRDIASRQTYAVMKGRKPIVAPNRSSLFTKPRSTTLTPRKLNLPHFESQNASRLLSRMTNEILNKTHKHNFRRYLRRADNSDDKYYVQNTTSYSCTSLDNSMRRFSVTTNGSSMSRTISKKLSLWPHNKDFGLSFNLTGTPCLYKYPESTCSPTPTIFASSSLLVESVTSPTTLFAEIDCPEETSCRRTKLVRTSTEDVPRCMAAETASQRDHLHTKLFVHRKDQTKLNIKDEKRHVADAVCPENVHSQNLENLTREGRMSAGTRQIQIDHQTYYAKDMSTEFILAGNVNKLSETKLFNNDAQRNAQNLNISDPSKQKDKKLPGLERLISKDTYRTRREVKRPSISGIGINDGSPEDNLHLVRIRSDLVVSPSSNNLHYENVCDPRKSNVSYESTSEHNWRRQARVNKLVLGGNVIDNSKKVSMEIERKVSFTDGGLPCRRPGPLKEYSHKNEPDLKNTVLLQLCDPGTPRQHQESRNRKDNSNHQTGQPGKDKSASSKRVRNNWLQTTHLQPDISNLKCLSDLQCLSDLKRLAKLKNLSRDTSEALLVDNHKLLAVSGFKNQESRRGGLVPCLSEISEGVRNTSHAEERCMVLYKALPCESREQIYGPRKIESKSTSKKVSDPALKLKPISSEKDSRDTSQISVDTTNVFTELCLHSSIWNSSFSVISETLDEKNSRNTSSQNGHFPTLPTDKNNEANIRKLESYREEVNTDMLLENTIVDSVADRSQLISGSGSNGGQNDIKTKAGLGKEGISHSKEDISTDWRLEIPQVSETLKSPVIAASKIKRGEHLSSHLKPDTSCEINDDDSLRDVHFETGKYKGRGDLFNVRGVSSIGKEMGPEKTVARSLRHSFRKLALRSHNPTQVLSHRIDVQSKCESRLPGLPNESPTPLNIDQKPHTPCSQGKRYQIKRLQFGANKDKKRASGKKFVRDRKRCSKAISLKLGYSISDQKGYSCGFHQNPKPKSGVTGGLRYSFDLANNIFREKGPQFNISNMAVFTSNSGIALHNSETSSQNEYPADHGEARRRHGVTSHKYTVDQEEQKGQKNTRNVRKPNLKEKQNDAIKQQFSRPLLWDWSDQTCGNLMTSIQSKTPLGDHTNRLLIMEISSNDNSLSIVLPSTEEHLASFPFSHSSLTRAHEAKQESMKRNDSQVGGIQPNYLQNSLSSLRPVPECGSVHARNFRPNLNISKNDVEMLKASLNPTPTNIFESTSNTVYSRTPIQFSKCIYVDHEQNSPAGSMIKPQKQLQSQLLRNVTEPAKEVQLEPASRQSIGCSCRDSLAGRPQVSHKESSSERWQRSCPRSSARPEDCLRHIGRKTPKYETFVGKIVEMFEKKLGCLPSSGQVRQTDDKASV